MRAIFFLLMVCNCIFLTAQDKELEKQRKLANNKVHDANEQLREDNFIDAEASYREAISTNPENPAAKYNLGNAYYNKESMSEAFDRYKEAVEVAGSKDEKHKAFHNMGNVFMKEKQYDKAVEAYKGALRHKPTDDETRYNLALAKKMLEKQQQDQDQNKDDQKDNKDQKDKKDDKKEGDNKEDKDKEGDKKDDKKEGDKEGDKDKKPEDDKEGQGDKDKDKKEPKDQKKGDDEPKNPKPQPGQLSPQQVKNLLQAMNNEEKKVQDKINAKKVKGVKVKNEKDW